MRKFDLNFTLAFFLDHDKAHLTIATRVEMRHDVLQSFSGAKIQPERLLHPACLIFQ
ncbi:hypothetical protein D3C72_2444890 [compost metagenome]